MKLCFDTSHCSQCHLCAYVCAFNQTGVPALENSALRLEGRLPVNFEVVFSVCCHCRDQFCLKVCPRNALKIDSKNNVTFDAATCNSCKGKFLCVAACPFDGIFADRLKERVVKCDLCGGEPECIPVCPQGVITLE